MARIAWEHKSCELEGLEGREQEKEDPVKKYQRRTAEVMCKLQAKHEDRCVEKFMWNTLRSPGVPSSEDPWRPADSDEALAAQWQLRHEGLSGPNTGQSPHVE